MDKVSFEDIFVWEFNPWDELILSFLFPLQGFIAISTDFELFLAEMFADAQIGLFH